MHIASILNVFAQMGNDAQATSENNELEEALDLR